MSEVIVADNMVRSFCTFRQGQHFYGIEVAQVREVCPCLPTTPVPQAPQAVRGLFNLRGRIYLALDSGSLLGLPPTELAAESRLIIVKPNILVDTGILVEKGGDIIHVSTNKIERTITAGDLATETPSSLISGVCKLQGDLMMIMDLTQLNDRVMKLFR